MSETETIVRDIFGDSDESDDEFEGFDGDIDGKTKQNDDDQGLNDEDNDKDGDDDHSRIRELDSESSSDSETLDKANEESKENKNHDDDDDEQELHDSEQHQDANEALPDISDSSDSASIIDDDDDNRNEKSNIMYDFDIMLQKRKEMNSRRRRRKNVDIINDSDDFIAELIQDMRQAAEDDHELNRNNQTATRKLVMLPLVECHLKKIDLREALLDSGILSVITDWLTRLPDGSLPNLQIREKLLRILMEFNIDDIDRIKASGIGKAVMYLYKHPKETKDNRRIAGQLIANWSRSIFNLDTDFNSITRDQREKRDLDNLSKFKRSHSDSGESSTSGTKMAKTNEQHIRPGDKGWVQRARVPMPSMKDYVIRPKSTVEIDMTRISSKKPISKLEKHMRNFRDMKKLNKMNRAIPISIEGRKMAL